MGACYTHRAESEVLRRWDENTQHEERNLETCALMRTNKSFPLEKKNVSKKMSKFFYERIDSESYGARCCAFSEQSTETRIKRINISLAWLA